MGGKVSGFNVSLTKGLIVGEAVVAGDKRSEGLVIAADDFFVGGKQDHLVGGKRKIAFYQVTPMRRIQTAQRGVDDRGNRPTGSAGKAPEQGGCEELTFSGGQAVEGQGLVAPAGEGDLEGFGIDGKSMDQIALPKERAEGF